MVGKIQPKHEKPFDVEYLIGGREATFTAKGKRFNFKVKGPAACSNSCPAGINVKAYINLIANRKFEEAIDVIRQANPFPAVCGRVCTRPCEDTCELHDQGDAVPIRALKRYASDYELARRDLVIEPCELCHNQRVAIIGAGPAGLTAAVDLINKGYPVTIFEAQSKSGGMLQYGIPPYRLPDRILKREIDWITALGVTIKTKQKINDPTSLLKKGYSAVLLAGGAPKSFSLGIPGEHVDGVIDSLAFLHDVNTGKTPELMGSALIIGAGSTAFDVARSAVRLGATTVTLVYRRGIKEMPADKEEIEAAQREGVKIVTLAIPKQIISKNNRVTGVEFLKAKLGKPDESGRQRPLPIPKSEFTLSATYVFPAIGARPDIGPIDGVAVTTPNGRVNVSEYGKTRIDGVFAAGDVETGPSSVVESIGRGHEAAKGIEAYLKGITPQESEKTIKHVQISYEKTPPSKTIHHLKHPTNSTRPSDFKDIEPTYHEIEAIEEASRCISCGPCYVCPTCLPNCTNKQLVAEIQNTPFLVKAPQQLSQEITETGPRTLDLKSPKKTTKITLQSLSAYIDQERCIGCGRCEDVCAYRAIKSFITKEKHTTAFVNHQACAGCSACVSVCPTGAISQGYMSDTSLFKRITENNTIYPGIISLNSFWNAPSITFQDTPGVVQLMSFRKPSPLFLIQALVKSGRGLLIQKPNTPTESHYLPWEESPDDTIQQTKNLLQLVGISPQRIQHQQLPADKTATEQIKTYQQQLEKQHLSTLPITPPEKMQNPLYETIILVRILGANPDTKPKDPFPTHQAKPGTTMLFEACLPLLHHLGNATKLFNLEPTRQALHILNETYTLSQGFITTLTCPSKGLLQTNIQNKETIVSAVASKNKKAFIKANPKQLLLPTPESYTTFKNDPNYKEKSTSLIEELTSAITLSKKKLHPIPKTIALHPACRMQQDPFYEQVKKILSKIPEIKIIELTNTCGQTGFETITTKEKHTALKLMNHAVKKGADILLCTSPYCQTHLQLSNREGSWQTVDIEITDIYQLLARSIKE